MTPTDHADRLNHILDNLFCEETRFPVNVEKVALEITPSLFPDSPITLVAGADLHGFDGALLKHPEADDQWGIIYSIAIPHQGRIKFTLAHELGHYFMHRKLADNEGFHCLIEKSGPGDALYRKREQEANTFAAEILMPRADFRKQIKGEPFSFDLIGHCADRYEVSHSAALSRWIDLTPLRALQINSCDGYMLWARSSRKAHASGYYFATRKQTIGIPEQSFSTLIKNTPTEGIMQPAGVWFENREVREYSKVTDNSDVVMTVLVLE